MKRKSRKQTLSHVMHTLIAQTRGSYLTREKYEAVSNRFCDVMMANGITHIEEPSHLAGKHLRIYIRARMCEVETHGLNPRTVQNDAACLRQMFRAAGLGAVANSPDLSNSALGIPRGNRKGTKVPMTDDELAVVQRIAEDANRPGLAALLGLCRHLGLRLLEALMANAATLSRWLREIGRDQSVEVLQGTKGGRSRRVRVLHMEAVVSAIHAALAVAKKQGGYLVNRADGKTTTGLKQARSIAHGWMTRQRIVPHALRYTFCCQQILAYERLGYSRKDAQRAVSLDLGHGTGRARWVKMVYARSLQPSAVAPNCEPGQVCESSSS